MDTRFTLDEFDKLFACFETPFIVPSKLKLADGITKNLPSTVSFADVAESIRRINPQKSPGPDNISGWE